MPTLYLTRHATPDWARTDIPYFTPPGPPLTPQGEDEARELGAFLREAGVQQVWASPMERAQRTAQLAAEIIGIPFSLEPGIIEWTPGEKDEAVRARMWPVWERACQHNAVALITHGGPITTLLAALGLERAVIDHYKTLFDNRNPVPVAGVWRAEQATAGAPWQLTLAFVPEAYRKQLFT